MQVGVPAEFDLVRVRYLDASDVDGYIALERDAEVKKFVNGPSKKPDEVMRADVLTYKPSLELLAIADRGTNTFVGRCGLLPVGRKEEVEVHCLLAKSHWRKGIRQQVIPFLVQLARSNGKTPVAVVDPGNAASLALLQRLGYSSSSTASSTGYQQGHPRFEL